MQWPRGVGVPDDEGLDREAIGEVQGDVVKARLLGQGVIANQGFANSPKQLEGMVKASR